MKCRQAEQWMDAALDEQSGITELLPAGWNPQRRAELETHLAACPGCRRQWEALRSAEVALRLPKPATAPGDLLAGFRRRLAEEERRVEHPAQAATGRGVPWRWLWPLGSLAAAGAAAAALFVFNLQPPVATIQDLRSRSERSASVARSPVVAGPGQTIATAPVSGPQAPAVALKADPPARQTAETARLDLQPPGGAVSRPATPPTRSKPQVMANARIATGSSGEPSLSFGRSSRRELDERGQEQQAFGAAGAAPVEAAPRDVRASRQQNMAKAPVENFQRRGQTDLPPGVADNSTRKMAEAQVIAAAPAASAMKPNPGLPSKNPALANNRANQTAPLLQQDSANGQPLAEPAPGEPAVSAAILTALQRPVEMRGLNIQVQDLAATVAAEAKVEVRVDPAVARLNVAVNENGVPLWRVLEDVARQAQLEIYPRDNMLVLQRPQSHLMALAPEPAAKQELKPPAEAKRSSEPPAPGLSRTAPPLPEPPAAPAPAPAGAEGPAGPAGSAGPAGPRGVTRGSVRGFSRSQRRVLAPVQEKRGAGRYAYPNRLPDRKIWPAAWGNLPERGFDTAEADPLPPLILTPGSAKLPVTNEAPQERSPEAQAPPASEKRSRAKVGKRPVAPRNHQ